MNKSFERNRMGTSAQSSQQELVPRQSRPRGFHTNPWFRLVLLAVSASLAILIWCITHSIVITLTIFIFGCRAMGMISEEALVKILSRGRKR